MNELTVTHQDDFMPVMNMEVAIQRRNYVVEFTKRIMVKDTDFGVVPGTGTKPTLLKPGAEKLATFFGLTPVFVPVTTTEDWTGLEHDGEPFFYYRYRCELHRNGNLISTSEGSCNSWESKYRYRKGERVCPNCGQAAIIKGKAEYGGGWLCFAKKGGCGAKFKDGDAAIEEQTVGRITNADVADQVNTFQKMAQKRALVAAVLLAVNASEFFTQDVEDMVIDAEWTPATVEPQQTPATRKQPPAVQQRTGNAPAARTAPPDAPLDGVRTAQAQPDVVFSSVPWYTAARDATTNGVRKLCDTCLELHRTGGPASTGPNSQYGYLVGLLDSVIKQATGAADGHKRVLPVLCQAEIGKDNPPSAALAEKLLDRLATHVKDGALNKIENPDYSQAVADAMVVIYRAAEAVATPSLLDA